ncbi:MAG: hypothetical protein GXO39_07290 [Thermotogae bacterium]|nr:hypothetical protein [Thermotogota bacterium]
MRGILILLLASAFGGCRENRTSPSEDPLSDIPHALELTERYREEEIGVPMYPGAALEYYENDFVYRGKALEARTALRTTDSMDEVVRFYRDVFHKTYGKPTYEYKTHNYYLVEKRKDSSTTFPFFVVAVADMGSYRRITLHRLINYDHINHKGNVLVPIRFR